MKSIFVCLLMVLLLFEAKAQLFVDQASDLGISHSFNAQSLMGGGVAFFDIDNDGDDDLYLSGGLSGDIVYRNDGNGVVTNISTELGLTSTIQNNTTGITTADIDNDGDRDLFVTTWSDNADEITHNLLFLNNGDGSFSDISTDAGITHEAFSIGANFFDYNKDGFLDIYVINHVESPAFLYDDVGVIVGFDHDCYPNFLYHNNGDNTFTEVGSSMGVASDGCGLAAITSDYDFDGDLDIMIANDFGPFLTPDELLQNNYPDDNFSEVGAATGADVAIYGMGIAAGDYDHDQDLDYYITNLGANVLLENNGGTFQDVAATAQVENTYANGTDFSTGWGTAFLDVDNDSWEDLYLVNGRIPSLSTLPTAFSDPNKLYLNNGDKTFTDVTDLATVGSADYCRGMAYSDFDQDGDLDIFSVSLNELGGVSNFYFNETNNANHYVQFKLIGKETNRDGYGSKVWVFGGGETFVKELYGGGASHVSQHTSVLHFGLGDIQTIDSVRVEWTNGHIDHLESLEIDQLHELEEGIISNIDEQEELLSLQFVVSPNPFLNYIEIETDQNFQKPVTIDISTISGKIIVRKTIELNGAHSIQLPEDLNGGFYLLSIQTEFGIQTERLVKVN